MPQPPPPRPVRYRYYALWKPFGVPVHLEPSEGGPSLRKFVPLPGLRPVGRLDSEGEGLLLLTDDPRFHLALTHPGALEGRVWLAQVERAVSDQALESLRSGVLLGDRQTLPAEVRPIPEPQIPGRPVPIRYRKSVETSWMELVLFEGWARQVRRMTAAVGHPTLRLVQWAVGPVTLEGMTPGQLRELNFKEVRWAERMAAEAPERSERRRVDRRGPRRAAGGHGSERPGGGRGPGHGSERPGGGRGPGHGSERPGGGRGPGHGSERPGGGRGPGKGSGRSGGGRGSQPDKGRRGPGGSRRRKSR